MKFFYTLFLLFSFSFVLAQVEDSDLEDENEDEVSEEQKSENLFVSRDVDRFFNDGIKSNAVLGISTNLGNSVRGLYGINVSFRIPKSNFFGIVGYSRQLHRGFYLYDFVLEVSSDLDNNRTRVNRTSENLSSGGTFSINIGYLRDPFNFTDGLITSFLYKNIDIVI